jgi:hypothetical protein
MKAPALFVTFLLIFATCSLAQPHPARPVVVSAQMQGASVVYRVNGRRVEDSRENSLLTNLGKAADTRGLDVLVFIIIDEHAPFKEVGKLETALDKIGLTSRRLFVADFHDGTMNEIHWDQNAIPIPPTTGQ